MTGFKLVAIFSITIAGLCVLVFLPWVLGVPGQVQTEQQTQYAEGWSLGLIVISLYPISISLVYGFNLIVWILSLYNKIGLLNLMRCQQISTIIAIALAVLAILQMIRAFQIISGS